VDGLTVASFIPLVGVRAFLLLFLLYVSGVRLFGPRFIDLHGVMVVAESPSAAIGRVDSLEPEYATDPSPKVAEALLDMLRATAVPVATGTEVALVGRAEPRLINAVRRELGHARMPRLQRPSWVRGG
jgi:hypothetical protein